MSSEKAKKSCVICRSPARCQNYGALTCEACKSFFRRANQGNFFNTYRCVNGYNCIVDPEDRKLCSFCRFQRCLKAGMDIRKGRDRRDNALQVTNNKSKIGKKREDELDLAAQQLLEELLTMTARCTPSVDDKGKFFTPMEIFDLDLLCSKYTHSFCNIPYSQKYLDEFDVPLITSLNLFYRIIAGLIDRLILFTNSITQYTELCDSDKTVLFKAACSELCMVNVVLAFDKNMGIWLTPNNSSRGFYKGFPAVTSDFLNDLLTPVVYGEKEEVTLIVQSFHPDETVVMLLYSILLFTPTRPNLIDVEGIKKAQAHFGTLLRRYLIWRHGESRGSDVFLSLVTTLKRFRKIAPRIMEKVHGPVLEANGAAL